MGLDEFINMGGYGPFIWSCYGLTLFVLIWNIWAARRELKRQIAVTQRRVQMAKEQGQ